MYGGLPTQEAHLNVNVQFLLRFHYVGMIYEVTVHLAEVSLQIHPPQGWAKGPTLNNKGIPSV